MSTESGFPGLPATGSDERQVANVVNRINRGKMNIYGSVTLAVSVSNTSVAWPNTGITTVPILVPKTASAAAESPQPWPSTITAKTGFTLTHTISATTSRSYLFVALG